MLAQHDETSGRLRGGSRRLSSLALLLGIALILAALPVTAQPGTQEAAERLAGGMRWQALDGPPGGNTHMLEQDHLRPRHLYVGAAPGLYRSADQGDTWTLLDPALTQGAASMAFGADGAFTCATGGTLLIRPDSDRAEVVGPPCYSVAAHDRLIYASRNSEQLREQAVGLDRLDLGSAQPEWVDVTPPREMWADLVERADAEQRFMSIDHLVATPERVFASVVLSGGPGDANRTATRLFASDDAGESWSVVDTRLPRELPLQRLIYDPRRDTLVALGHEHRSDGAFQPIHKLARVSRDGGRTWRRLTTIDHIASPTISDVDFVGRRTILTNVDQSVLELRGRSNVKDRWMGPPVKGYSFRFTLDELVFDHTDPDVIYGRGYLGFEGIIRSRNGGRTWQRLTGGMAAAPAANLTVHPTDPGTFIASGNLGYLPHITRDGGETWQPLVGGSSMADEVVYDPADPDNVLMMSELSALLRSRDGGDSWKEVARQFSANRIHDFAVSADGDSIYAANLGTNVSRLKGLRPGDEIPFGEGENLWYNLLGSPDYAYALAAAPDGMIFASGSPRKFEDHASVWRFDPEDRPHDGESAEAHGWSEALRVDGSAGITDVVVGPGKPWRIYAGVTGEQAGVWGSRDRGRTWEPVHADGFDFVTVHAVAIDPADPDVIYAAPWGAGLYRSPDAGATWERLDAPTASVAAIVVDGDDPQHVLLGDRIRPVVWESTDGAETWAPLIGFDDAVHYRIMAMAQASDGLYVSLLDRAPAGLAVFAGVPESGSTFRVDEVGPHRIEDLPRAALAFAEGDDGVYAVGHIRGIYRITEDRAQDISRGLPAIGFNDVLIDGDRVLVAGGVDLGRDLKPRVRDPGITNNIYQREPSGAWRPLLHDDPFGSPIKHLEADPAHPGMLYAATGTGLHVSPDGGATWHVQNEGLSVANIGSLAIMGDRVVAGTLGGGTSVGDRGAAGRPAHDVSWRVSGGPRPHIANVRIVAHPRNPSRLWASSYPGGVFRSDDGGRTWAESNFGLPSFEVADPLLQGYYSLALDPSDPNRLYLAIFGHGIFRSTDGAATWLPLGRYGSNAELMTSALRHILVDPEDSRTLWLASADKGIFRSGDGGRTWRPRNRGLRTREVLTLEAAPDGSLFAGTAGYGAYRLRAGAKKWQHLGHTVGFGEWTAWDRRLYQYSALLFDPAQPGRIMLGHFPGGFFISDDDGHSWRSSNVGIGNDGMFSLVAHPEHPERIFAGTYNGILRSDDSGATWHDSSTGMPPEQWPFAVVIDDQDPDVMYATTKNGQNKGFCERNHDSFCGVVMRSLDGGKSWHRSMDGLEQMAEYYMLELDPRDHDVLYLSSSRGIYVSPDRGEHWTSANAGLPVEEFFIRDNVAQNMKLTADGRHLLLGVVGYGIWRTELPDLSSLL